MSESVPLAGSVTVSPSRRSTACVSFEIISMSSAFIFMLPLINLLFFSRALRMLLVDDEEVDWLLIIFSFV